MLKGRAGVRVGRSVGVLVSVGVGVAVAVVVGCRVQVERGELVGDCEGVNVLFGRGVLVLAANGRVEVTAIDGRLADLSHIARIISTVIIPSKNPAGTSGLRMLIFLNIPDKSHPAAGISRIAFSTTSSPVGNKGGRTVQGGK